MTGLNRFLLITLSLVLVAGQEPPCGHVQELSRATLYPSTEIFIYSGPYFYLYDLKSEKLGEKYSMDEYYPGAPTDMEAVTLYHDVKGIAMLIVKGSEIFLYEYKKGAFSESPYVTENMNYRKDVNITVVTVSEMKEHRHEGQAYSRNVTHKRRLMLCMGGFLHNCVAKLSPVNPVDDCEQRNIEEEYRKECRGIAIAQLDDVLYLALANDRDLLLFQMDDNAGLENKPYKRLSLSTIFSCGNSVLLIVVLVLLMGVVIILIAIFVTIWMYRRQNVKKKVVRGKSLLDTVTTADHESKV